MGVEDDIDDGAVHVSVTGNPFDHRPGWDSLRFDPDQDVPVEASLTRGVRSFDDIAAGGYGSEDLADLTGSVADLGTSAAAFADDPLNFLISAGLSFLIDVVQPLEDILALLTGDPERMEGEIEKWERVAEALPGLGRGVQDSAVTGLIGWRGEAAEAALTRLEKFSEGVTGLAGEIGQLAKILGAIKAVMELAQQIVIGLIAQLVEWLIITWSAAMASAGPTYGGSMAAAATATEVKAAETVSRAVGFVDKVVTILNRLRKAVEDMFPKLAENTEHNFSRFKIDPRGHQVPDPANYGKIGPGTALGRTLKDWKTYAPGAAGTATSGAELIDDSGPEPSPSDVNRKLGGAS